MRELEMKCVVDDGYEIRPERIVLAGAVMSETRSRDVQDTYFDTADLRLARWGLTLRWREGDGWTVKIPRPNGDERVLDRDEVHFDGPPGQPPPAALALVTAFVRDESLVEVARLHTRRTARVWSRPSGATLGELVDDHVTATARGEVTHFREIEFELAVDGDHAHLRTVIEALELDVAAAVPKLVRVLGSNAAAPPDVVVSPLPEHPSAADVARTAIASSVHRLLTHVPAARVGTDPEGVHQARVATRRLRSDLRTFAPLLDTTWTKQLRRELRWLATELGNVRDADVLDGHLADALDANPAIDPAAGAEIRARLATQRAEDRDELLGHLADARAIKLFDHLVDAAAAPPIRRRARKPADRALPPLVHAAWQDLTRSVGEYGPSPTDNELHQIRIKAKRVRYAAEAVAPAIGKAARRFAKAAAGIQATLGDLNDGAVAAEWLESAAATGLTPGGAFAAGRLVEQLRTDAAIDRTRWQADYDKMHRHSDWLEPPPR